MGAVAYFVHVEATNYQTGGTLQDKFGPYNSMKEAESKKQEQEEARGRDGYDYKYRIEKVPTVLLSKK